MLAIGLMKVYIVEVIVRSVKNGVRGLPSQVKGAGFRAQSRRGSPVRIRPHALQAHFLSVSFVIHISVLKPFLFLPIFWYR